MKKKIILLPIIVVLLLSVTSTFAAEMVRSGIQACGGSYFTRNSGLELHDSIYMIRNHNDDKTITIDRVAAWDPDGNIVFDSTATDTDDLLPINFKSTLLPHQGTKLLASDLLGEGNFLPVGNNAMQVHFEYSLGARGYSLSAVVIHPASVDNFHTSRHLGPCRSL